MTKPAQADPIDIQGPAKETDRHEWNRPALNDDMKPITGTVACTVVTPLWQAFKRGHLKGGNPKYSETERWNAGDLYGRIYKASERGGRDSTQALNVSRSSTQGSNNDSQQRAWDSRLAIGSYLSAADRKIIEMVCGDEDVTPAEAVRDVHGGDFKYSVPARFRCALDSLIEAIKMAEKHPRRFYMGRVT